MWYSNHSLGSDFTENSSSHWVSEEAGNSRDAPDPQGITGFPVQQQFQSVSHLGLAAAGFYGQCLTCWYTSLFPKGCPHILVTVLGGQMVFLDCWQEGDLFYDGVITSWWQPQCWKGEERGGWGVDQHADILWCLFQKMVLFLLTIFPGSGTGYQTQKERNLFFTQTKVNCHRFLQGQKHK